MHEGRRGQPLALLERRATGPERVEELQRQAGKLLDPEVVEALVSVRDDLPGLIEPGADEFGMP